MVNTCKKKSLTNNLSILVKANKKGMNIEKLKSSNNNTIIEVLPNNLYMIQHQNFNDSSINNDANQKIPLIEFNFNLSRIFNMDML